MLPGVVGVESVHRFEVCGGEGFDLGRVAWVLAKRSRWVAVYPPGSRPVALRGDPALACRNLPAKRPR